MLIDVRLALVSDTYAPQVNGVTTVLRRIVRAVGDAGHLAATSFHTDFPAGAVFGASGAIAAQALL